MPDKIFSEVSGVSNKDAALPEVRGLPVVYSNLNFSVVSIRI